MKNKEPFCSKCLNTGVVTEIGYPYDYDFPCDECEKGRLLLQEILESRK